MAATGPAACIPGTARGRLPHDNDCLHGKDTCMGASSLDDKPTVSATAVTRSGAASSAEPTLGALVASASRDLSTLIRSEMDLAKAEIKDDVAAAAKGGAMFGAAGFLGLLASIVLSFALAYGIDTWLATWLAFLIVGAAYLLLAGLLALVGKRQFGRLQPPKRTINSTKKTVEVLKGAAKS
jgi:Putative Actinobacterial Holin-X, holin superfamily III